MVSIEKVTISLDNEDIKLSSCSIEHTINELPTAIISVDPLSVSDKSSLMKPFKLIYNGTTVFSGICDGLQTQSSYGGIGATMSLVGGPVKLARTQVIFYGLQALAPLSLSSDVWGALMTMLISLRIPTEIKAGFKTFFNSIYNHLIGLVERVNKTSSKQIQALSKLYILSNQLQKSVFDEELEKIEFIDATCKFAPMYEELVTITTSPNMTFLSFIQHFCNKYQLCISTQNDKTRIFPMAPIHPTVNILPSNKISAISLTGFPLNIYTRCNVHRQTTPDPALGTLYIPIGIYPKDKQDEPTELETFLGTMNIMNKELDSIEIPRDPTGYIDMDGLAKSTYMQEVFQNRSGVVTTKMLINAMPGIIIQFTDPQFEYTYRGFVTRVRHDFDSMTTTMNVSHVISDGDAVLLKFEPMNSPLYPSFNGITVSL